MNSVSLRAENGRMGRICPIGSQISMGPLELLRPMRQFNRCAIVRYIAFIFD
jgi:hypothetical protein